MFKLLTPLFILATLFVASPTHAQSSNACTNYYVPGVAIPTGYAPPWDLVFSSGQLLVNVTCTTSAGTLTVGRGNVNDYVYKLGYLYQNNAWAPLNLTSSSALQSNSWYIAQASVSLPASSISATTYTYVVGYVCSWNGSAWKCGCTDVACATSQWQLQAYLKPAVTTTTTTGSTTGGPSASGTTITPGTGSITDAANVVWTITSGGVIQKNGTNVQSSGVILGLYYNGSFYQENNSQNWYQWNGSTWTQVSGDPRGTTTTGQTAGQTTGSSGPVGVAAPSGYHWAMVEDNEFTQWTSVRTDNWQILDGCCITFDATNGMTITATNPTDPNDIRIGMCRNPCYNGGSTGRRFGYWEWSVKEPTTAGGAADGYHSDARPPRRRIRRD
jgi:hypothetical protein